MNYSWDWGMLFRDPYAGWIVSGFTTTCILAIYAWLIAFSFGSVIGVLRTLDNKILRTVGTIYVEIFRNIPLLAQMFLWYFVIPELLPADAQRYVKRGMPDPQFWTAVVALGFYTASRVAEQVRSGIQSIPRGQQNAALAMGFSRFQVYRYVLLPIGYRTVIPSLTNDFLGVFKNSSLALTLGVMELTATARQIEEYTFQSFEPFMAATVLYSCVTLCVIALMRFLERKSRIIGAVSAGGR
ncbi:MAG: amino acid ABC transporter permease [Afipia felis]|nr:amino acid ABC transporter permease [Afipia felis]